MKMFKDGIGKSIKKYVFISNRFLGLQFDFYFFSSQIYQYVVQMSVVQFDDVVNYRYDGGGAGVVLGDLLLFVGFSVGVLQFFEIKGKKLNVFLFIINNF